MKFKLKPSSLSPAKHAANIANAQKSTGPATAQGKAISARNSFKHGLASANLYVPEHLRPLYEEISEDLAAEIRPEGTLEDDAFSQLRDARFTMERIKILQAELARDFQTPGQDPLANPEYQKQFNNLQKYYRSAHRDFRANMKELRLLQTERRVRAFFFPPTKEVPGYANYRIVFGIREKVKKIRENGAKHLDNGIVPPPFHGDIV